MKVTPFAVSVAEAALADLRQRLQLTRWPHEVGEGKWEYGMPRKALRDVVAYWRDRFDWRAAERRLNEIIPMLTDPTSNGLRDHARMANARQSPSGSLAASRSETYD